MTMYRYLVILLLFVSVTSFGQTSNAGTHRVKNYLGKWKPIKKEYCNISGLSEEEANAFMKSKIVFTADTAYIFDDRYAIAEFEFHKEAVDEMIPRGHINPMVLNIVTDSIDVLTLKYDEKEALVGDDFLMVKQNLLYNYEGVFYILGKESDK